MSSSCQGTAIRGVQDGGATPGSARVYPPDGERSVCSRIKRFARFHSLAVAFLVAEVAVGYAGWFTPRHEVFPFSAWVMFALVPNRLTNYDLLRHAPAASPPGPPQPFSQSGSLVHAPHSVVTHQLIQQFGEALEAGDAARVDTVRRQVEEQFATTHLRYDLVKVAHRPVPRWQSGEVLARRPVCSFVATEPPLLNPDQAPPLEQDPEVPLPAAGAPNRP